MASTFAQGMEVVQVEPTYYALDFGFRPPLRFPERGPSSARPRSSFSRSDIVVCYCCSVHPSSTVWLMTDVEVKSKVTQ